MLLELPAKQLVDLVARQLNHLFVFNESNERKPLEQAIDIALKRCEYSFNEMKVRSKYYVREGEIYFNPFHSGQYTIFLYFLSNTLFTDFKNENTLADRVYYLNKALNSVDLFYEIKLPDAFFLDHPVGSVMGRADYGERFSFSQNCTVGNNRGQYPRIGKNVKMLSGSKIVGQCNIGDNVIFAANSYVIDTDIPECSIVFGMSPKLTIKHKDLSYFITE